MKTHKILVVILVAAFGFILIDCGNGKPLTQASQETIAQVKNLEYGDLVKLKNGRIYYIFHGNGYSFSIIPYIGAGMNEYQTNVDILATQTEKIIKKGDPDYDSAGLAFFKQEALRP